MKFTKSQKVLLIVLTVLFFAVSSINLVLHGR